MRFRPELSDDPEAAGARKARRPVVAINGKFYGSGMNGVNRVADRLIRGLDALAAPGGTAAGWDMRLLVPRRAANMPTFRHIRVEQGRFARGQFWEQAVLPFAAAGGVLVNLANVAPILHPRTLVMVHDAQFRLSPHSYAPHRRWGYRMMIPAGAWTSRRIVTVSEYARDTLGCFGVAPPARTGVIHNGGDHILDAVADPGILARLGLARGRFCLLFWSAAAYKNVDVVLRAWASSAPPSIPLVIVGGAGRMPDMPGVVQAGRLDDGAMRALYEAATCLLFPSRTEGFGLPPLEAMACGCPVIAAPLGAVPEICRDAILYASPSDAADWARQVAVLSDGAVRRMEKAAQGRARAAQFAWATASAALADEIAAMLPR